LVVGAVYVVLHVLGSRAARSAEAVGEKAGSRERASGWLWAGYLAVFAAMAAALPLGFTPVAAAGFVVLAVLQDTWRPLMITRIDDHAPPDRQATILSIESQGQSLFSAVAAPLVGVGVDALTGDLRFLPVAGLGLVASAAMLWMRRGRAAPVAGPAPSDGPAPLA
jgi:hypothetical protein